MEVFDLTRNQFTLVIEALGDALEKQEFSILKQRYEIDELRNKIAELEEQLSYKKGNDEIEG